MEAPYERICELQVAKSSHFTAIDFLDSRMWRIESGHTSATIYATAIFVITSSTESGPTPTVTVNGLSVDAASFQLRRLQAIVRGTVQNSTTGQAASGLSITLIPAGNDVANVDGSPALTDTREEGSVIHFQSASNLLTTTDSDGAFTVSNIAVDTLYDLFVTSEGFRNAGNENLVSEPTLTFATTTNAPLCAPSLASATTPITCLGAVDTAGGILDITQALQVTPQ